MQDEITPQGVVLGFFFGLGFVFWMENQFGIKVIPTSSKSTEHPKPPPGKASPGKASLTQVEEWTELAKNRGYQEAGLLIPHGNKLYFFYRFDHELNSHVFELPAKIVESDDVNVLDTAERGIGDPSSIWMNKSDLMGKYVDFKQTATGQVARYFLTKDRIYETEFVASFQRQGKRLAGWPPRPISDDPALYPIKRDQCTHPLGGVFGKIQCYMNLDGTVAEWKIKAVINSEEGEFPLHPYNSKFFEENMDDEILREFIEFRVVEEERPTISQTLTPIPEEVVEEEVVEEEVVEEEVVDEEVVDEEVVEEEVKCGDSEEEVE